ncbi:hypothetical protein W97_00751 [Coniosporium apollinis CBS 100218]|uniref:RBR-type E3 ubiquitin transferase n=1 Tax=Coniosporium apollinis (strain CBS 100218) TaxID=1168221 RepID=R7YIT4_CONA1|nr:uncharacterized protein W97_00751 [Coniosporium apollinis CBS 100218]EON61536.1 hypothetical protein W97_00751 [Coniosporium apollinis CBS 100218]
MANQEDEREEELSAITAIFPELVLDEKNPFKATIDLPVAPASPLTVVFPFPVDGAPPLSNLLTPPGSDNEGRKASAAAPWEIRHLSYLPPLRLHIILPAGYPAEKAPQVQLSTSPAWLPKDVTRNLEAECAELWEEYGHGQVVFAYIDYLQQAAERGFDLAERAGGMLEVAQDMKIALLDFDIEAKREKFEQETFDCGVCLEPKKGSSCHRMVRCGHVFCVPCLQDFYNNAITEGDVASIKCLAPDCGKDRRGNTAQSTQRKKKRERTLNPSELLQIPLERTAVQRYVELKRKKKLESDKTTVYCPRTWCQGPARSKKYPKVTNLSQIVESDSDSETETPPKNEPKDLPPSADRLRICEDCNYAFCRVCLSGWHGEFVRCWPRSNTELTEEEKASYDYIRLHTSPCPTCSSPCQKTMGCNHMNCFQCRTHFCYLCGAWLDAGNPYQHFNQPDKGCYMRLWELEGGDEGNGEVHFDGARGWEAAIAAANEADAAQGNQDQNRDGPAPPGVPPEAPRPPRTDDDPPPVVALQQMQLDEATELENDLWNDIRQRQALDRRLQRPAPQPPQPRRRQRDPAPAAAPAAANAAAPPEPRVGLQRFLQMVRNDEEDGWDSDELEDVDGGWDIPER